jgi:hypothetical protein
MGGHQGRNSRRLCTRGAGTPCSRQGTETGSKTPNLRIPTPSPTLSRLGPSNCLHAPLTSRTVTPPRNTGSGLGGSMLGLDLRTRLGQVMSHKPRPALPRSASGHISAVNKPIVAEDWDLSKSVKKSTLGFMPSPVAACGTRRLRIRPAAKESCSSKERKCRYNRDRARTPARPRFLK